MKAKADGAYIFCSNHILLLLSARDGIQRARDVLHSLIASSPGCPTFYTIILCTIFDLPKSFYRRGESRHLLLSMQMHIYNRMSLTQYDNCMCTACLFFWGLFLCTFICHLKTTNWHCPVLFAYHFMGMLHLMIAHVPCSLTFNTAIPTSFNIEIFEYLRGRTPTYIYLHLHVHVHVHSTVHTQ